MDDDDPTITLCRAVAGEHSGGPGCWCRPLTMTASAWDRYIAEHPADENGVILGMDS